MLRWLTVIATILIVTVVFVTRDDKFHNTEGKGYDIKCTQSSDPSATVGTLICTAQHSQKAKSSESDPPWWHVFFTWPEGITAWAIMLTLGAIIWQAWETRKAATAAGDSIKLQETAYYQWVEIVNWTSSINTRSTTPQLDISVEVMNSTDFPIRLSHVEMSFIVKPRKTIYAPTRDRFLPPKTPLKLDVTIDITEENRASFLKNALGILIAGNVSFKGVLGKPLSQNIEGVLICGLSKDRFEPTTTMHPKSDTDQQKQG
jgi:hypothetical protein